MATKWYEAKVSIEKTLENGATKAVPHTFLVDALSITEADARITEEVGHLSSKFDVQSIRGKKINEIFFEDDIDTADKYYLVKVAFITIDEKTAVEKRKNSFILVQASDFNDAVNRFNKGMSGTMADYDILSIAETPILDVFRMKVTIGDQA